MNFAFLCHSPADRSDAHALGEWLERNCPCEVRYIECGDGTPYDFVEAVEQSMAAIATVVLLSATSVPQRVPRERWEPVLLDEDVRGRIAYLRLSESKAPALLERHNFFRDRRNVRQWLLQFFPRVVALPRRAAAADEDAIEDLRRRVADEPGAAEDVPADAALAFAQTCERDFEGVIWLDCTRRSRAGVIGDLCDTLRLKVSGIIEENEAALRAVCASRRLLLILDNFAGVLFPREGKCSVVITEPHDSAPPRPFAEIARAFSRWSYDEGACLALLRDLPSAIAAHDHWPETRGLGLAIVALLRHRRERAAELRELLEMLVECAWEANDPAARDNFDRELSWVPAEGSPVAGALPLPAPGEQLGFEFI